MFLFCDIYIKCVRNVVDTPPSYFTGMEQFEQLLTCAICLDRYRNPKLLPCQHSFCMEPCMDGLVDYVRRQVKCPECRAEHRIPYQVSRELVIFSLFALYYYLPAKFYYPLRKVRYKCQISKRLDMNIILIFVVV